MYPNYYQNQNRGFVVPFLLGGLAGGLLLGLLDQGQFIM